MVNAARRSSAMDGFTLIEVMIALVILAFGVLGLALMQLQALTQSSQGRHTGDALAVARSHIEQVNRIPWSELDVATAAATWIAPSWVGSTPTYNMSIEQPGPAGTLSEQSYSVEWLVNDVGTAPICLRDVQVRVTWAEEDYSNNKTLVLATRRYNWGDPSC